MKRHNRSSLTCRMAANCPKWQEYNASIHITALQHSVELVTMFRPSQTRILLSDYEFHHTIHSILTQRIKTLNLAYCPPVSEEEEDEAEFYDDSFSTSYTKSSSVQYFMSEDDRRTCEVLKRYRDTKIYMNPSTSDLDDLPAYSAGPRATLGNRSTNPSESYQSEGAFPLKDWPSQPLTVTMEYIKM